VEELALTFKVTVSLLCWIILVDQGIIEV